VLGGSSSINGMVWVRGNPLDFDGWVKQGAEGWGYRHVLPYFRRADAGSSGSSAQCSRPCTRFGAAMAALFFWKINFRRGGGGTLTLSGRCVIAPRASRAPGKTFRRVGPTRRLGHTQPYFCNHKATFVLLPGRATDLGHMRGHGHVRRCRRKSVRLALRELGLAPKQAPSPSLSEYLAGKYDASP